MSATDFYIIDLERSSEYLVFWCPVNKGYTSHLERAGRYSREAVLEKPWYYNNGEDTIAVPCSVVEQNVVRFVAASRELIKEFRKAARLDAVARVGE